ncbi:neuraminidase-like domain-containing protein [Sphaerothrix gracilis]|uniref:Tc toxin subunit A-related protein n=1 Tax=Sphaerothrix gracilis TaxID=3151835 RepID=UPI0031FC8A0F
MRATIQLTQLANKNAVLKALITAARDHTELQQNLITTGFRFESLSPATVAALKQKLDDLRHPSYTLIDRTVTILAYDNSLNGLFKVILAILQANDDLTRTLWTQGLIIQNLSQSQANILKRQLEAESAQVTLSADENRDQPLEDPFTVKGVVRLADQSALPGVTVQALDIDFRAEELLGEAITNLDGAYQITYTTDQFASAENQNADLMIRVVVPSTGIVVATSDIRFNAGREETINLTITLPEQPDLSEYEKLVAALSPIVGDVSFASLTDDDTAFLTGETGQDRQRIEYLRLSALLSNETGLPTYVFYGFGRRGLPLDLESLLNQDTSTLRDALTDTIEERIIPDIHEDLDAILDAIEQLKLSQGVLVNYSLFGQLLNQDTETPLSGFAVNGAMLTTEGNRVDLGQDITQIDGGFTLTYTAPRLPETEADPPQQSFRLEISTPTGEAFHETDITVPVGRTDPVQIALAVPAAPDPSPAVAEVQNTLNLDLSPALQDFLSQRNLQTLADIRTAGGLQNQDGVPDDSAVAALDAHANLNVLSEDIQRNQILIDRSFTNILDIARTTEYDFVTTIGDALEKADAAQIHAVARAEVDVLTNLFTNIRAEVANGFPSPLTEESANGSDPVNELLTETCQCRDCDAAVSPSAYLMDLLNYTTTHIKNGTQTVTLPLLETTFHQPFGDLPTTCNAVEQQIRQVRLCIEVLRQASVHLDNRFKHEGEVWSVAVSPDGQRIVSGSSDGTLRLWDRDGNLIGQPFDNQGSTVFTVAFSPDGQTIASGSGDRTIRLWNLQGNPIGQPFQGHSSTVRAVAFSPTEPRMISGSGDGTLRQWNLQGSPLSPPFQGHGNSVLAVAFSLNGQLVASGGGDSMVRLWNLQGNPIGQPFQGHSDAVFAVAISPGGQAIASGSGDGTVRLWNLQGNPIGQPFQGHSDAVRAIAFSPDEQTIVSGSSDGTIRLWDLEGNPVGQPFQGHSSAVRSVTFSPNGQTIISGSSDGTIRQWDFRGNPVGKSSNALTNGEANYRWTAYETLLEQLGTSYADLRDIRSADEPERQLLATRLGIQASRLNALFFDPDTLTEFDLEKRFGLADTTRDRLSASTKTGDSQTQLTRWSFAGVEWNQNTDIDGKLYVTLSRSSTATLWVVDVYRDPERTQLVASGNRSSAQGTVELLPENNSGLSGTVEIDYQADTADIEISVIPDLLTWQLQQLRDRWQQLDWPEDETTEDTSTVDSPPILDPDLVGPADLRTLNPQSAEMDLWQARRSQLDGEYNALKQAHETNGDDLGALLARDEIGLSIEILNGLVADQAEGKDITSSLDDHYLTREDFAYIQQMRRLVEESASILVSEWADLYAALVQVSKRRQLATWRDQEKTFNGASAPPLVLSPDHFRLPDSNLGDIPQPKTVPSYAWQSVLRDRRTWQRQLQSRLDQEQAISAALQEAVSTTEELTLPLLRDALIQATAAEGNTIETKAKGLRDRLLIETQANSCQYTTRTAQAIETIQSLIWSIRTGQLQDTYPDLTLDADNFDEEWQWIGSYTSWRSAMFVFLYPENLLLPQLRRWQTPAFQTLVQEIRNNRRLTPVDACQAAERYAQYFEDICKLRLAASVISRTKTYDDDRCRKTFKGDRHLIYLFAQGGVTNTVYVSAYDPKDETSYAQSFWEPIPGIENPISIVGAAAYTRSSAERYIYLFVRVGNESEQQLVFTTYNLEQGNWSGSTTDLDLPEDAQTFTAVVKQRNREDEPPHLAIRTPDGAIYTRKLDDEGKSWEEGDWYPTVGRVKGREFSELLAMIEPSPGESYLLAKDGNQIYYRFLGRSDDGRWRKISQVSNTWIGSFRLPGTEQVYIFWKPSTSAKVNYQIINHSSSRISLSGQSDIKRFSDWLDSVTGMNLSGISSILNGKEMTLLDIFLYSVNKTDKENFINKVAGHIERNNSEWQDWSFANHAIREFTVPSSSLIDVLNNFKEVSSAGSIRFKRRGDFQEFPHFQELSNIFSGISDLDRILCASGEWLDDLPFLLSYKRTINNYDTRVGTPSLRANFDPDLTDFLNPARIIFNRAIFRRTSDHQLEEFSVIPIAPTVIKPFDIIEKFTTAELQKRRRQIQRAFEGNSKAPASVTAYLEEAWYFVPIYLALELQQRRQFTAALDWFRTVYDYSVPIAQRFIFYGLAQEQTLANTLTRSGDWLLDPLNIHAIAVSRPGAYTRFTILSLIQCFLEFADAEFTRDTAESLPRAKTLYATALELLDLPNLKQNLDACNDVVISIDIDLAGDTWDLPQLELRNDLSKLTDPKKLQAVAADVQTALESNQPVATKVATARNLVQQALAEQRQSSSLKSVLAINTDKRARMQKALLKNPVVARAVNRSGKLAAVDFSSATTVVTAQTASSSSITNGHVDREDLRNRINSTHLIINNLSIPSIQLQAVRKVGRGFVPSVSYSFCTPPNPILRGLKLQAEVNLFKLQNCRNIAGDEREILPYAAATDVESGLTLIGTTGQITLTSEKSLTSTPYRYEVLIERAKQLIQLAAQIESNFLAALEKRDAEYYTLMKARHDVQFSRAGNRLRELQFKEAQGGVELAFLQKERGQIQFDYYQNLVREGRNSWEKAALLSLGISGTAQGALGLISLVLAPFTGGASLAAFGVSQLFGGTSSTTQLFLTLASFDRRQEEWKFQRSLAQQDIHISKQQIALARDRVRTAGQERLISEMQSDFAESTAEFLANKFTNADLYDWMSNILEGVYSFFLQQATGVAKLAEQQLAFERQETTPAIIQADYWTSPTDELPVVLNNEAAVDRRGLTGSARLLADIFNLDQYRFDTERRKLQLTKTISLARQAPAEFQQFRETGTLTFATPMQLFDQDFPGHYLRLIKRIRTSTIALIPPTEGIKATLSTNGISRIATTSVIKGQAEALKTIKRNPESVALSSPREATGLFELTPQTQEMLLPFEGMGVDTNWELQLPKPANPFDYSTIADVLFTIEYTALADADYRRTVIQTLDRTTSGDRPFSFRNQFADQWFDLNNSEQTATPMTVTFETRRTDFPPNLEELVLAEIVFYFVRVEAETSEITVENLKFTEKQTGNTYECDVAVTQDGIISTASGKAPSSWNELVDKSNKSPIGEWQLALPNTDNIRNLFQEERIEDILFVITYQGQTPPWPA